MFVVVVFCFNREHSLSIHCKIAIKNFLFKIQIFTYKQVAVQNVQDIGKKALCICLISHTSIYVENKANSPN